MRRHFVVDVADLPDGSHRIITIGSREIGVFNVNGRYYALRNLCPHHGAPVCRGMVTGTMLPSKTGIYDWARDGEILRCPWHGWEFEIATGHALTDERLRVNAYKTFVENEQVFVEL